jgi:uncharacterized membrane protein
MKKYILLFAVASAVITVGCLKDHAAEVKTVVIPTAGADTITYSRQIKPIIDNNCAMSSCHATGCAPRVPLTTYSEVCAQATAVQNHVFVIQDMPPGGMSATELSLLQAWLNNGKKQ